jgi:Ca2+-binding RTX toxin-like protein
MIGGQGDDVYQVESDTDVVVEHAGGGVDTVESEIRRTLGDHVEHLRLIGDAEVSGTGNALDNHLTGNHQDNGLHGRGGDDRLDGRAGADWLHGDEGDDYLYGGDDFQIVEEADYYGGPVCEVIANNDRLDGGTGADTLDGGSGEDELFGGDGDDYLYGGHDFRNAEEADSYGGPVCGALANDDRLDGGSGADMLDGGSGADELFGGAGRDGLRGGAGDDILDGGGGADTLRGGDGNDVYIYTPGNGVDRIADAVGANVVRIAGPLGQENVVARRTTTDGVTTVHVRLVDGHGNEMPDQGVDFVLGADGVSPITGLEFGNGTTASLEDVFAIERRHQGSFWSDRLETGRADDIIRTGYGFDIVTAGGGRDTVYGESGWDALFGQGGSDRLFGGTGWDALAGGRGFDTLSGSRGFDVLRGGSQNDVLLGGSGIDHLAGGSGNDVLAGGEGYDGIRLTGGADVVLFNAGDGPDRVDFGHAKRLTISLGGDLRLDDLTFHRIAGDLVLGVGGVTAWWGGRDGITLEDWYEMAPTELPAVTLQTVMEASTDFDLSSGDPRRNRRFVRYDLNVLAEEFGEAGRNGWSLAEALLDAHLESSEDSALGGEPAYRYGLGGVDGISTPTLVSTLSSPRFGESPQRVAEPSA